MLSGCKYAPETILGLEYGILQKLIKSDYYLSLMDDVFLDYYNILDGTLDFYF